MAQKRIAEFIGTFWLVFTGCGSALFAANFTSPLGIGFLGVAFAFGLSVLTMAYAVGPISGAHLNPAVTLGLVAGRRFPAHEAVPYILSQVAGALFASIVLYLIARGKPGFILNAGFPVNGYGEHSPGGYGLGSAFLAELILTFSFVFIILAATDKNAPSGFAPIAIGLALTLIHLVDIPITNASVNPARSTGPALVLGGWALSQLWLFWVAPVAGGVLAGFAYPSLASMREKGFDELESRRAGRSVRSAPRP
jgi:aquaporin Z